jgi:hypothetical protein
MRNIPILPIFFGIMHLTNAKPKPLVEYPWEEAWTWACSRLKPESELERKAPPNPLIPFWKNPEDYKYRLVPHTPEQLLWWAEDNPRAFFRLGRNLDESRHLLRILCLWIKLGHPNPIALFQRIREDQAIQSLYHRMPFEEPPIA